MISRRIPGHGVLISSEAPSSGSAAANGQLRTFGGGGASGDSQTYDVASNTWSSSTSFYAGSPAATAIGNTFFAAGGERSGGMFGSYSIAETETSAWPVSCEPGSVEAQSVLPQFRSNLRPSQRITRSYTPPEPCQWSASKGILSP